jgi:hypothetical protein
MIGARESSPYIMFTILGFSSTIFTDRSLMIWKNTSGGNTIFLAVALASSSASVFFVLSTYSTVNLFK